MFGFGEPSFYNRPIPKRYFHKHAVETFQQHRADAGVAVENATELRLVLGERRVPRPLDFHLQSHSNHYLSEADRFHPLPLAMSGPDAIEGHRRGAARHPSRASDDRGITGAVATASVTAEILRQQQRSDRTRMLKLAACRREDEMLRREEATQRQLEAHENEQRRLAAMAGTSRRNESGWGGINDCYYVQANPDGATSAAVAGTSSRVSMGSSAACSDPARGEAPGHHAAGFFLHDHSALPGIDPITHQPRSLQAQATKKLAEEVNEYSYAIRQKRLQNLHNAKGYDLITGQSIVPVAIPPKPEWLGGESGAHAPARSS